MAKAKVAPKLPDVEFFYDEIEQRSEEWFTLRRGIPTASKFSSIMAEGKDGSESLSKQSYMDLLVGEIIWQRTAETFRSEAMQRGVEMEPIARNYYARGHLADLTYVGFVRRLLPSGRYVGCSPDSQVGRKKGLEIKTMKPELIVPLLREGAGFPPKFRAQLQGTLWITEWETVDLVIFYEGADGAKFPVPEFTVIRDEVYIKRLSDAVEVFDFELDRQVQQIRSRSK